MHCNKNMLFDLDEDVATRLRNKSWERLDSVIGVSTHMNLQS